jgi:hypothetical protein
MAAMPPPRPRALASIERVRSFHHEALLYDEDEFVEEPFHSSPAPRPASPCWSWWARTGAGHQGGVGR